MTKIKLAIAAAIVGALTFSHIYVYYAGRSSLRNDLLKDRVTILKDGKEVDDEVLQADDNALCELLGGCVLPDLE